MSYLAVRSYKITIGRVQMSKAFASVVSVLLIYICHSDSIYTIRTTNCSLFETNLRDPSNDTQLHRREPYGLGQPRVHISTGGGGKASVSLLQNHPDRLWGSSSPLCNLYRGSFPRVKRSGNKAYHSPPSTAVVKNEWSYTFAPPICLQSLDRDKFLTLRFT